MQYSRARVATAVCLLWAAAWVFLTRYSMLDDSLIHLRYAANLAHLHFVTYDGIHHTFGSSSPLYLTLLTAAYAAIPSVFVPKAVSVIFYVALLGYTAWFVLRRENSALSRGLALLLLAAFCSPMGVRWLADGMESGLVCLAALLLARFSVRSLDRAVSATLAAQLFAFGFFLTLLRVELISLCGICSLAVVAARLHRDPRRFQRALTGSAPLVVGAVFAMLLIHFIFGAYLPDTALAKAYNKPSLYNAGVFLVLLEGSLMLGIGTLIIWVFSALFALRRPSRLGWAALVLANSMFPILVLLACLRGQAVQGVRYFLWAMLFSIPWNLYALAQDRDPEKPGKLPRGIVLAASVLLLLMLPADAYFAAHTMLGRAKTFQQLRSQKMSTEFSGRLMLADDIGFIGYFTQADICDLNGLVNGRSFAALTQSQRIQNCVDRHPDALFLTTVRLGMMRRYIPELERDWIVCERVDFPNVRTNDTHYLLVRRTLETSLCPAGSSPQPVSGILGTAGA